MRRAINVCALIFYFLLNANFLLAQSYPIPSRTINVSNNSLQPTQACLSDKMQSVLAKLHPELIARENEINNLLYKKAESNDNANKQLTTTTINIPVVVHVIHNNGPENISDQQIIQGIQDLNDAFNNSGAYYNIKGVATGIQFCLAQQDPSGLPTTGITRMVSTFTNMVAETDDALIKTVSWNPYNYLNIFLVNEITSVSLGSSIAGYAYFPSSHGRPEDGIVNEARWFGSSTDNSKIHIHEAGHYLGLYHTFNGGCANNDCLADGDHVCDTPPDNSTTPVSCGSIVNTCTSDEDDSNLHNPFRAISLGGLGDQPDMFQNYMDYGLQTCQYAFTNGQKVRMVDAINNSRSSLLISKGCTSSCGPLYAIMNLQQSVFTAGVPFTVMNFSAGYVPYTFEWLLNGTVISTDTTLNYTINTAGTYSLTIRLYNTATGCYVESVAVIIVNCNFESSFSYFPAIITPGITATFTPSLTNLISYKWYVDEQLVSQNILLTYSFNAGRHSVFLIADNGNCSDTSEILFLPVGDCTTGADNNWILTWNNNINFSSGTPTISVSSNYPWFNPTEGIASISDKSGKLLFYSDGRSIYNSLRDTMQNGSGLIGGGSSTQAVIIIAPPQLNNIYYVFTTDDFAGQIAGQGNNGWLAYSIVDMSLDSGKGSVTQKNILLMTPTCEKLTATLSCDGQSVWLISRAYFSREFYSYKISSTGVDTVPVISIASAVIPNFYLSVIGCMKASPKGDKLAAAYRGNGFSEIYDFDNATGIVSNPVVLASTNYYQPYGVEFSPDGSKLYVSNVYDYYFQNEIYQYDLSSGINAVIASSETMIGTSSSVYRAGSLQAAPNGKIYSIDCGDYYLDEISNPNAVGLACNFKKKAVHVPNYMNGFGLPNSVAHNDQSFNPKITGPLTVCSTADSIKYKIACSGNSVAWFHHGPNQLISSNTNEAIMRFTIPGYDSLIVTSLSACNILVADTIVINSNPVAVNLGKDTSMCLTGSMTLDAGPGFISYLWQNSTTSRTIKVAPAITSYSVIVTGVGGCTATDSININIFSSPLQISLGNDIYTCGNIGIVINAPGNFSHYLWQDGSTNNFYPAYMAYNPNHIILEVTDSLGCKASDELIEYSVDSVFASLPSDTTLCNGNLILLKPDINGTYNYHWQDGSTLPTFTATHAGTYWVTVSMPGCLNSVNDTIQLFEGNNPLINLGTDTVLCPANSFLLQAGNHQHYIWQDNSVDSIFNVTSAGTYWVIVNDSGCFSVDTIHVSGCVGLLDPDINNDLFIYPNPTSGIIYFYSEKSYNSMLLDVYTISGEKVYSTPITEKSNKINLTILSDGLYLIKLSDKDKTRFGKIIIEK